MVKSPVLPPAATVQVWPPSLDAKIVENSPAAQPSFLSVKTTSNNVMSLGDFALCQCAPASSVCNRVPSAPTAAAVCGSIAATLNRFLVVPDCCLVHVLPPSLL